MINILIVEDDNIQRKNLIKMINEVTEEINIYEADNEEDALKVARENNIYIFYIDITLKNSSGLSLALNLRKMQQYSLSCIVFVTTHKQHTMSAFKEVHCYDYIIKPYNKEKVKAMTKLIIDNIRNKDKLPDKEREYVVFECNKISVKIYLEDIFFIEVKLRNVIVHTKNGRFEFNRMSLKKVKEMVCNDYIVQAHRSYIINVNNVQKVTKDSSNLWEVQFVNYDEAAYISLKYKDDVDKYLYNKNM